MMGISLCLMILTGGHSYCDLTVHLPATELWSMNCPCKRQTQPQEHSQKHRQDKQVAISATQAWIPLDLY